MYEQHTVSVKSMKENKKFIELIVLMIDVTHYWHKMPIGRIDAKICPANPMQTLRGSLETFS